MRYAIQATHGSLLFSRGGGWCLPTHDPRVYTSLPRAEATILRMVAQGVWVGSTARVVPLGSTHNEFHLQYAAALGGQREEDYRSALLLRADGLEAGEYELQGVQLGQGMGCCTVADIADALREVARRYA